MFSVSIAGLAIAPRVQVVAGEGHRPRYLSPPNQLVRREPEALALPEPEKADPRRQALDRQVLPRKGNPALGDGAFGKELEGEAIEAIPIRDVAGNAGPAKGSSPLFEQVGAPVAGDETGVATGFLPVHSRVDRFLAHERTVLEDLGADIEKSVHRPNHPHDARPGALQVLRPRTDPQGIGLGGGKIAGHDSEGVVEGAHLGDDLGHPLPVERVLASLDHVGAERNGEWSSLPGRLFRHRDGLVEGPGLDVHPALLEAADDHLLANLHGEGHPAVHGHRLGLRAAHAPEPAAEEDPSLQGPLQTAPRRCTRGSRRCPPPRPGSRCTPRGRRCTTKRW